MNAVFFWNFRGGCLDMHERDMIIDSSDYILVIKLLKPHY